MPSKYGNLSLFIERLLRYVAGQKQTAFDSKRSAAVLVCLFEGAAGEIRVLLTRRSTNLSSYAGQVSLPGGKTETSDENYVETALREANEEIGIDRHLVDVVAVLPPFLSKEGVQVVPVVGLLVDKQEYHPVLNSDEVESLFDAPLEMFLKDVHRREKLITLNGESYTLQLFDYKKGSDNYVIWAFTAGILIFVASVIYGRSPQFHVRNPSFWMTPKL